MNVFEEIQFAKLGGAKPRVHGNGFIQLDVAPGRRLHFWGHRSIPRQRVSTPIHDHTFNFVSQVLKGRLFNIQYVDGVQPAPLDSPGRRRTAYKVYSPDESGRLADTGMVMAVWPEKVMLLNPGEVYEEFAYDFHETTTDRPTVTLMQKTGVANTAARSRILVPLDLEPDNDFDGTSFSEFTVATLWNIVYEIVDT